MAQENKVSEKTSNKSNHYLIVVKGFVCPRDPRVVGRGLLPPGTVSHSKLVLGEGTDKE